MKPYNAILDNLEDWIRSGNLEAAQKSIDEITKRRVPRNLAKSFANVARRIGYHRTALRILNPIIRSAKPIFPPPQPEEKLEYAITLARCGLITEANEILNQEDVKTLSDSALYQAFVLFSGWDFAAAIPFLEKYISNQKNDYQNLVGRVNLALAYSAERKNASAEKLMTQLLHETMSQNHFLLHGNVLEMFAMFCIEKGEFKKAHELILRAKKYR